MPARRNADRGSEMRAAREIDPRVTWCGATEQGGHASGLKIHHRGDGATPARAIAGVPVTGVTPATSLRRTQTTTVLRHPLIRLVMTLVVVIAAVPPGALPDAVAARLMNAVSDGPPVRADEARRVILARDDLRFVAVLIEVLRAGEIGVLPASDDAATVHALEALSGQTLGTEWPAWVEWYGGTALVPPPGFMGWKGRLLARVDPRFADFLRDGTPSRIRPEEVVWGGVPVDGIPALIHPAMIRAAAASYLNPSDPVFGLAIHGDARAYPLRILDWHEMVNDVVGGVPVALAYCTLCGAGIAYDARGPAGTVYTFGSSGLLFRSNKLMYDHQTRTLWNQLTGEPVLGPLAAHPAALRSLPVVLTAWADWRAQHPATHVLDLATGYDRPYVPGVPYGRYFSAPETMFPVWRRSRLLPPKTHVYTLYLDGVPKAYPLDALAARRVVNDTVGRTAVVLVATRGIVTVSGRREPGPPDRLRAGGVAYSAGGEVRAYRRGRETFAPGPGTDALRDSAGRPWRITEDALVGPHGIRAPRTNGFLAYWFGWYTVFPRTLVYQP